MNNGFPTTRAAGTEGTVSLDPTAHRLNLPAEHMMARRVVLFTLGVLAQLEAEANWFRVASEYIRPYGDTVALPIFQKIFLGGEYSIRGFDLRFIRQR